MNNKYLFKGLNKEQLESVCHDHSKHGALLIIAGAGSGKTNVLTKRIAYLINQKIDPSNILAITFTKKAAAEMKERVESLIDKNKTSGKFPLICTFHSLGLKILKDKIFDHQNSYYLGYKNLSVADEKESASIIRNTIIKAKKEFADKKDLKTTDILNDVLKLTSSNNIKKINDPFYKRIISSYCKSKKESGVIDFSDMLKECLNLFHIQNQILKYYQNKFKYILIDEYQDTNQIQYEISKTIAGNNKNIFVVGDDDQSIYRFRGADVTNIQNFRNDFPKSKIIKLEINYRSTENIIKAANNVFKSKPTYLRKILRANKLNDYGLMIQNPKIKINKFRQEKDEMNFVIDQIEFLKNKGIDPGDIAILFRLNEQKNKWQEVFKHKSQKNITIEFINNISFCTVHASKGLQYSAVFCIGINQGVFPYFPKHINDQNELKAQFEEEKRLFYVAITRAKYFLYLTASKKQKIKNRYKQLPYSEFFECIPKSTIYKKSIFEYFKDLLLEKSTKDRFVFL